jgi:membrane protease subunit HflK
MRVELGGGPVRFRYPFALSLVAYLLTGVYQVGPDERAVVKRFGRVVARPGPGLNVGAPWGIDRVERVPVRAARQVRVGFDPDAPPADAPDALPPGQLLTGDQNLVNVQLVLDYSVGEGDDDLDNYVLHRGAAEAALARAAEALAAEWAAGRTIDQVLLTGNSALPVWVMDRLAGRVADQKLGVRVLRANVGVLAPPDEVRPAFDAVNQAQTAIRTRETQARQEAEVRLSTVRALEYKLEQEAAQFRDEQLAQATADATAFENELAAYRTAARTNRDALAALWWFEMQLALDALAGRGGEVKPLDHYLQSGELNIYEMTKFFGAPRR